MAEPDGGYQYDIRYGIWTEKLFVDTCMRNVTIAVQTNQCSGVGLVSLIVIIYGIIVTDLFFTYNVVKTLLTRNNIIK